MQTRTSAIPSHFIGLLLVFCAYLPAFSAIKLNSAKIKTLYQEGEFEKVREDLEDFLKKTNSEGSREDRIIAYKYLGVIYGSKPGGKPQSETYFFRLFDLAPKVNLNELYVSSSIDQIFRDTRERFIAEKQSSSSVDEFGNAKIEQNARGGPDVLAIPEEPKSDSLSGVKNKSPIKNTPNSRQNLTEKKTKVWPWILGAAVIGGGVGVYFMTSATTPEKHETLQASF
jgi:hypothetical protein